MTGEQLIEAAGVEAGQAVLIGHDLHQVGEDELRRSSHRRVNGAVSLSSGDLAALATSAFGPEWQSKLARERGIVLRTMQRWARDGIGKPETAVAIRAYLLSRRVIDIPAPASHADDQRDEQARNIMLGLLGELTKAAGAVGWREAEMLAALSATIDRMMDGAEPTPRRF